MTTMSGASGQSWPGACEIGEGSPHIVDVRVFVIGQAMQDPDQQIVCVNVLGILRKDMRTSRPLRKAGKCPEDFRGLHTHFCGLRSVSLARVPYSDICWRARPVENPEARNVTTSPLHGM
ncbi:hypothetical protein [Streptomyces sp. NPDC039016]|uniref:hypothetical protein n=1 Tax=Streptomyces sp. NPDC039016 TaxID=3154330 RepID=UPI00340662DC